MKDFIPFALPDIGREEIKEVVDTLRSNWITTGPKVARFEKDFAGYIGAKYAVALNSATAGLHLALDSIGLAPQDKVITTPYTFTATAEVIRYFGADPVFIDVRRNDYNIDPVKMEEFCIRQCSFKKGRLIHKKTGSAVKAVIPVHIGGCPCEMDKILGIAGRYNLKVIDDAAHALPSYYKGRKIGAISDITVFSFYATKTMTTGEGGMLVTDNPKYYKRIKMMRLHGIDRDVWNRYSGEKPQWYYEVKDAGYKYNMTDIAGAIGLHQLRKVDKFLAKRRKIASMYNKELGCLKGIKIPQCEPKGHSWHLYIIEIDPGRMDRNAFIKKLSLKGIGTSVHFIPLHIHPFYRKKYNFKPKDFPVSYEAYKRVVSLPIYTKMTEQDVYRVVRTIKEAVR